MSKKILFSLDRGLPGDTKYGASLSLTIDDEYVISAQLLDQNGDPLGEAQTIDLPLESMVVDGSYDSENKALILTLDNGNTISIPIADLINGLQAEITPENKLSADLVDDSSTENKFVTEAEKEEIATISSKLDKVSTPNKIYGTDSSGEQTNYDLSSFSRDLNIENGSDNYSLVQKEGDTSTGESDDRKNYAYGRSDAAFGHKNKTYQRDAFAFGGGNKVGLTENEFLELYPSGVDGSGKNYSGSYSFSIAIGENNEVTSRSGSALGVRNEVSGQGSVALGGENNVTGSYSLAAGSRSSATGIYSVAVGQAATASNQASFAAGISTLSSGVASVAEGDRAVASGRGAHAEGTRNTASGNGAHAEGFMSDPAIGSYGLASGVGSHVENVNNIAKGVGSHAGGCYSIAQGAYHFVHGSYLISSDTGAVQAVFGKYNADDVSAVFVVGNGTAENARSNAFEVTHTGIARAYGTPVGDNDLTPKSYVDALKPLSGAGAPTSSTAANYLGQTYIDTANKIPYMCVDIDNGTYTWVAIAAVSLDYSSTN